MKFWKKKPKNTEEQVVGHYGRRIADAIEKQQEQTKDISEPVWMIVKALEERPRSFYVKSKDFGFGFYSYTVVDRVTKAVFRLTRDAFGHFVDAPFALSDDENELLIFEGRKWLFKKKARVQERKRKRWQRIYEQSGGS